MKTFFLPRTEKFQLFLDTIKVYYQITTDNKLSIRLFDDNDLLLIGIEFAKFQQNTIN